MNNNMPKVSVIIPIYNVEKYLNECVDSILCQSYKNIEVILVNDGSTDSSGLICDDYKKKYDNIKVIHKQNAGLGFARNSGIDIATGEYLFFLDSDDYVSNGIIEKMIDRVKTANTDTCLIGYTSIDNNKKIYKQKVYEDTNYYDNDVKDVVLTKILGSLPECNDAIEMKVNAQMYSKKIFDEYSIRFCSERELASEDLVFDLDYFIHSDGVSLISTGNYFYRINPKSLSRSYNKNNFNRNIKMYEYVTNKIDVLNLPKEAKLRYDKYFLIGTRTCIRNEALYNIDYKDSIKNVNHIVNNSTLVQVINNYPVYKLGTKQRIFAILLKNKFMHLIYILFKYFNC